MENPKQVVTICADCACLNKKEEACAHGIPDIDLIAQHVPSECARFQPIETSKEL